MTNLLAIDLIESVNDVLKRVVEAAVRASTSTGTAMREIGGTLGDIANTYAKGVTKGIKQATKKQGPADGERVFRWLRRTVVAGTVASGSSALAAHLMSTYPHTFAWLRNLVQHLL